jgi:hypothetical protein
MIGLGPIVCGGGWKSQRHCRIEFWRTVLFLVTLLAALTFSDRFGLWGFLAPLSVFVVPLILFRFKRFRTWLGLADQNILEREPAPIVPKTLLPNIPPADLHTLHVG